jgi:hypothetical protein
MDTSTPRPERLCNCDDGAHGTHPVVIPSWADEALDLLEQDGVARAVDTDEEGEARERAVAVRVALISPVEAFQALGFMGVALTPGDQAIANGLRLPGDERAFVDKLRRIAGVA